MSAASAPRSTLPPRTGQLRRVRRPILLGGKKRRSSEKLSRRAHFVISGAFAVAMLATSVLVGLLWPIDVVPVASMGRIPSMPPETIGGESRSALFGIGGPSYGPDDLHAHFVSASLKAAKKEFDAGRYAKALSLLESEGHSAPVRYLRGLAAQRAGKLRVAADELSAAAENYPALSDRAHYEAGVAYERVGDWKRAQEELTRVRENTSSFDDARLLLAKAMLQRKDLTGARSALEPLLDAEAHGALVRARALLSLSNIERAAKNKKAERDALTALWAEQVSGDFVAIAASRLGRLGDDARVLRAQAVLDSHKNRDALTMLRPLIKRLPIGTDDGCLARVLEGKALRKERRHAEAIAALTPVLARCKQPELRARAMYVLGESQAVVDPASAVRTYDQLATEQPKHSFADDALFSAAELDVMRDKPTEALRRLARIGEEYAASDHAAQALFKQFWLTWKTDPGTADTLPLERIERMSNQWVTGVERARARYWHARALEARNEAEKAVDLFELTARRHAGTWHGQMARAKLTEIDQVRAAVVESESLRALDLPNGEWRIEGSPPAPGDALAPGVELYRLELADARRELLWASKKDLPATATRLLFHLLDESGNTQAAYGVARAAVRGELGEMNAQNALVWAAAFPRKFRDSIEKSAGRAAIDPDLLQAIVREESAFGPTARSGAGALGLTQLMPDTAAILAKKVGLPAPKGDALFNPHLNLRLGAQYLGQLRRQFSGEDAFAIASYNAGPGRVARWAKVRGDVALDEWVEEIPIDETRGYVGRVMSSYRIYGQLRPLSAMSGTSGQR